MASQLARTIATVVRMNYEVCFIWNVQDSFVSNLLRLIHTMKPPKKKKKKKAGKQASDSSESTSQPVDPVVEEKKKRFPGLSLPDNEGRVQGLLLPEEREGNGGDGVKEDVKDVKVASEALNEVRNTVCSLLPRCCLGNRVQKLGFIRKT